MPDTMRLFVALYPPAAVAGAMLARLLRMDLPRHRATPADQVHLTLQFIGDTDRSDLASILESVQRSAAGIAPVMLSPLRLVTLPQRGPARLMAAETDAPAPLLEMQRRLAHRLARSARERAGDRFVPHFSLLRFAGSGVPGFSLDKKLEVEPFRVDRIFLMESTLRPEGAQHREVGEIPLAGC